jgi:hypothetical protein
VLLGCGAGVEWPVLGGLVEGAGRGAAPPPTGGLTGPVGVAGVDGVTGV